jgi:transposase-like protein
MSEKSAKKQRSSEKRKQADLVAVGAVDTVDTNIIDPLPGQFEGGEPANKYDYTMRSEAVRLVVEEGLSLVDAGRRLGVTDDTIGVWLREMEDEVRLRAKEHDISLIGRLSEKINQLAQGINKDKIDRAGLRDIAIALGILIDKRKDLAGPGSGAGKISMKIAWQDGSGAVELTTGGQE